MSKAMSNQGAAAGTVTVTAKSLSSARTHYQMSFPRKRESRKSLALLDPRFRGGDVLGSANCQMFVALVNNVVANSPTDCLTLVPPSPCRGINPGKLHLCLLIFQYNEKEPAFSRIICCSGHPVAEAEITVDAIGKVLRIDRCSQPTKEAVDGPTKEPA